jgi:hypothetical protein
MRKPAQVRITEVIGQDKKYIGFSRNPHFADKGTTPGNANRRNYKQGRLNGKQELDRLVDRPDSFRPNIIVVLIAGD